ncbi:MAG: dockerin type I domain-containing protein [Flavobacteriales bacterium]|nr:dockerin type I domain-containing protein [Flavobacteriales bacterium]
MKKLFYILFLLGGLSMISQNATAQVSMDRQAITSGYHTGAVDAIGDVLGEIDGSIGQVFTTMIGDGNIFLTQGFHQMAFRECPGDVTGDNAVGTSDLLAILSLYGAQGDEIIENSSNGGAEDLNEDGIIGTADLLILLAYYGELCN